MQEDEDESHDDTIRRAKGYAHVAKFAVKRINKHIKDIEVHTKESQDNEKETDESSKTAGNILLRVAPRCRLNLDDAVVVLRNLSFSSGKEKTSYSKAEIENIVGQRVQSAMLAMSKSAGPSTGSGASRGSSSKASKKNKKNKDKKENKRKASEVDNDFCYDCGSTTHRRGDDSCPKPSFMTKRLKDKGRYSSSEGPADKKEEQKGTSFRPGSNPEKRNHH